MPKRAAKQRVSYVEVDSDADLAVSDDELMKSGNSDDAAGRAGEGVGSSSRGKGDTYGARKPVKKKARMSSIAKDKGKGKELEKGGLDVKLLLDLPFDMLAEVCTHLRLADLVHLASTSRALRELLLSKSGAQFWGLVRRENGYVLPDGMGEIEFALLLEGKRCQRCGSSTHVETLHHLRIRLCNKCKKQLVLTRREVANEMSHLHSYALDCLPCQRDSRREKGDRFLRSALDEVNDQLQDLEDEDEQARAENERFRWKTRSRGGDRNVEALKDTDHVERWVEAKQAHLAKEEAQMDVAVKRQQDQQQEQKIADGKRARQLFDGLTSVLTSSHGWSRAQIQFHAWNNGRREKPPISAPAETPEDNPEGWRIYRSAMQQALDRKDADKRAAPGRRIRTNSLRCKFEAIDRGDPRFQGIFPDFDDFKELEAVKPLWHPEDAQLDDSTWPVQEPLVLQAVEDWAESTRVHAIRNILAAQSGRALKSLSTNPANYPAGEYDAAFFGRITARVFVTPQPRRGGYWTSAKHVVPFPAALPAMPKLWELDTMHKRLKRAFTFRHVWAIRTVIEAARLDEPTVTPEELDALGCSFHRPACPRKRDRGLKAWKDVVELLEDKGPRDSKLKAGATVKLEYKPPHAEPADFKGKGKAVDVDLSGEDSDSGSDGSSDEDGSTNARRRRRRNSTDDSEGDDDVNDAPCGSARPRCRFYTSEGSEDEEDEEDEDA